MKSIRELYRIGLGPSSSHTMGPRRAAEIFHERHPEAAGFNITLYGSLGATGKGHMTDVAILDVLPNAHIIWMGETFLPFHPNGMLFESLDADGHVTDQWTVFSIGGGALAEDGSHEVESSEVYDKNNMTDILEYCKWTAQGGLAKDYKQM